MKKRKPFKKPKPKKGKTQKIGFLAESDCGLIYLEVPLANLGETILAVKKQLEKVREKEKACSLGEI